MTAGTATGASLHPARSATSARWAAAAVDPTVRACWAIKARLVRPSSTASVASTARTISVRTMGTGRLAQPATELATAARDFSAPPMALGTGSCVPQLRGQTAERSRPSAVTTWTAREQRYRTDLALATPTWRSPVPREVRSTSRTTACGARPRRARQAKPVKRLSAPATSVSRWRVEERLATRTPTARAVSPARVGLASRWKR